MARPRTRNVELPRHMQYKHGAYYYINSDKKWIHLGKHEGNARLEYYQLADADGIKSPPPRPDLWAKEAVRKARRRAKVKGMDFVIDPKYVQYLYEKSGGRCMVSGIAFDMNAGQHFRARPWIPSLDRIDSSRGYVEGNCQLVCYAVNSALNEYGLDVLIRIAEGVVVAQKHK